MMWSVNGNTSAAILSVNFVRRRSEWRSEGGAWQGREGVGVGAITPRRRPKGGAKVPRCLV